MRLISIILAIYGVLYSHNYSIVFVHIGKTLPRYLEIAIDQARLFNKDADVYLIANKCALKEFNKENIHVVFCSSLKKTLSHKKFEQTSSHNTSFREGFWRYATERFFYIDELMQKYNLSDIVYIESDNMVYVDFSTLIPIFQKHYPGIAAVFANNYRCIPSVVYFSSIKAIRGLTKFLSKLAHMGCNDMYAIALYRIQHSSKEIDFLPSVIDEYSEDFDLISPLGHICKNKKKYSNHLSEFDSIFDTQAIGQYLGGQDLRNKGKSFPGQINNATNYNPSAFAYEWIEDEEKRAIPYIIYKDQKYRINNIHVHSKELKKFCSMEAKIGPIIILENPDAYVF